MANRLADETSPYLLQHAHNPVDWYPWGDEAHARARREERPILLSIGYSACHWCHVMERESFEDPGTASLMNRLFVNVKVDREERPDVDQVYMKAVQAMTGSGGWPMTVFLTPDLVPYFGGTYFPPEPRPGMPSFPQVLEAAADAWENRREAVLDGGARLLDALRRSTAVATPADPLDPETVLESAYRALAARYDPTHGGFGRAPKFPQPATVELVLRHHLRTGDPTALEMVVHTLRRMAAGGMRDHLGGGFHRYSVDERWLVPHFEKMLYDNALLARLYVDAYRATGSDDLADVAAETLEYVLSDLRGQEGAFYSARDADSEGEEGTYYLWTPAEVDAVLDGEDARLFKRLYDVSPGGNFEGRSILHLPHPLRAVATSEGLSVGALERRMAAARRALLAKRAEREAPFRDEKVLTSWNAFAVRALAEAGATLGREEWIEAAITAADFVLVEARPEGRLLHAWARGTAKIHAFLEDHAALGNACLSLHGATLEARWLDVAVELCEEILERFRDEASGAVFDTAVDAEALVLRPRDPMDGATPSGPSLAAELLWRAGHLLDDDRYRAAARAIVDHEAEHLERFGPAFGRMLTVLDATLAEPVEVVVVGLDGDDTTRALVRAAHEHLPSHGIISGRIEGRPAPASPLVEGRTLLEGAPAAYVCRAYTCHRPVADPDELRRELAEAAGSA